jgi:uncharacterized protein YdhG (YjbR/CyaY superfamily)
LDLRYIILRRSIAYNMSGKPKTVDEYLGALDDEKRRALEALRETIVDAAPGAVEGFAYGVPGFRYNGEVLVTFAAFKGHCGFYPMSPDVIEAFSDELKGYSTAKGTIRFQPDNPLPAVLVRKIVKARMAEIDA